MVSGKSFLSVLDQKGRLHIPLKVREEMGIYGQVLVEEKQNTLIIKPLLKIDNPLSYLASLNIKTKKTPCEMKREAEEVFGQ